MSVLEELERPDGIIPVDAKTTGELIQEIRRLQNERQTMANSGGSGGGTGYARPDSLTTTAAHVPDVIDGTIGSLQHAIERIDSARYRLERIADRFVGTRPSPVNQIDKAHASNPTIANLMEDLGGGVERLFTELQRFETRG